MMGLSQVQLLFIPFKFLICKQLAKAGESLESSVIC